MKQIYQLILMYSISYPSSLMSSYYLSIPSFANSYSFLCGKNYINYFTDAQRYLQKRYDPGLCNAILELAHDRNESTKNAKAYEVLRKFLDCLQGAGITNLSDSRPLEEERNNPNTLQQCWVALSRGPLASYHIIKNFYGQGSSQVLTPYNDIKETYTLLKKHGEAFTHGLRVIVLYGLRGQTALSKEIDPKPSIETTKLSLVAYLLNYLDREIEALNKDLLFDSVNKDGLDRLIKDLTEMKNRLPEK